jgi:hypothetical protein
MPGANIHTPAVIFVKAVIAAATNRLATFFYIGEH